MKKVLSTVLSAVTVMSMCSIVAIPAVSAVDTEKATIYVSDFMGSAYDKSKSTQTQLANKSTNRGSYQFEVGDLVNVTVSYQSSSQTAISGFVGHTFINQTSASATSSTAFKENTNSSNNTMVLSDKYYTSLSGTSYSEGTYIVNHTSGMLMANPETATITTESTSPHLKDKVSYTSSIGAKSGMNISTETKMVTFTVEITNATECYLYSAIEDAVDTTDDVNSVVNSINVKTSLEKVGSTKQNTSVATVSKSIKVSTGDIVVYNVKAKSSSTVGAFAITTTYDSSEFELYTNYSKDGVNTIVASQGGKESVNTKTAGTISTSVTATSGSPYDISTVTNLQTIKLVAKKNGTFTISASLDSIVDSKNNAIKYGGTKLTVTDSSSITVADPNKIGAVSKSIYVKKGDIVVYTVKAKTNSRFKSYNLVTTYDKSAFELYTKYSTDGVTTMKLNQGGTESVKTKTLGTITVSVNATDGSPFVAPSLSNLEIVKFVAQKTGTFTISTTIKNMVNNGGNEMVSTSVKFTNTSSVVA